MVAYNGITNQANVAADFTTVNSYAKTLKLMSVDGALPTVRLCLGPSGEYPSSACSLGGQDGTVDASWNNKMKSYGMNSQPDINGSGKGGTQLIFTPLFLVTQRYCGDILVGIRGQLSVFSQRNGVWDLYGDSYSAKDGNGLTCYAALDT